MPKNKRTDCYTARLTVEIPLDLTQADTIAKAHEALAAISAALPQGSRCAIADARLGKMAAVEPIKQNTPETVSPPSSGVSGGDDSVPAPAATVTNQDQNVTDTAIDVTLPDTRVLEDSGIGTHYAPEPVMPGPVDDLEIPGFLRREKAT